MLSLKTRIAAVLCGATLVVVGSPAASYAIFDWLCPWSKKQQTTDTTYVPPFSGRPAAWAPRSGAATVAPATPEVPPVVVTMPGTCCYVPQTCYRTVYGKVPVTSYMPVTCYDPCSGCPQVTYRPVTTWSYRAMLQPYSTDRVVYTIPGCGAPASPAAWGVSGVARPGCSNCATTVGTASMVSPVPVSSSVVPMVPYGATTTPSSLPAPALAPIPAAAQPLGAPSAGATSMGTTSTGAKGTTYPSGSPSSTFAPSQQNPTAGSSAGPSSGAASGAMKGTTSSWPETRQRPAAQPEPAAGTPGHPALNAPNQSPAGRLLREVSYPSPDSPTSEGAPRVTLRVDNIDWQPVIRNASVPSSSLP